MRPAARVLPPLYAIVDATLAERAGWAPPALGRAYLRGGARLLQLRAKEVGSRTLLEWSDALVSEARRYDALVVINDRADVAAMAGAAGVHVGQRDLSVEAARRMLGPGAVVGLSTHSPAEVDAAPDAASYLAVGPIFETRSKAAAEPVVGTRLIRLAAARRPDHPIVAIGGITLDRAPAALEAGAASVAVISDLLTGGDPEARARAFVARLAHHAPPTEPSDGPC